VSGQWELVFKSKSPWKKKNYTYKRHYVHERRFRPTLSPVSWFFRGQDRKPDRLFSLKNGSLSDTPRRIARTSLKRTLCPRTEIMSRLAARDRNCFRVREECWTMIIKLECNVQALFFTTHPERRWSWHARVRRTHTRGSCKIGHKTVRSAIVQTILGARIIIARERAPKARRTLNYCKIGERSITTRNQHPFTRSTDTVPERVLRHVFTVLKPSAVVPRTPQNTCVRDGYCYCYRRQEDRTVREAADRVLSDGEYNINTSVLITAAADR